MSEPAGNGERAKTLSGRVVSDKMDKTITVMVERLVKQPLYGKYVRRSAKLLAHDEHNEGAIGDLVSIESTRPTSKRKAWRLRQVLAKAPRV